MSAAIIVICLVLAVVASTVALIIRGVSAGARADQEANERRQARKSLGPLVGLTIRPLAVEDEPQWRKLWDSYCFFYGKDLPETVTQTTWTRLNDAASPILGYVAVNPDGQVLGFCHLVLHFHTWSPRQLCYLEDLFVDASWRGRDIGHSLIQDVWEQAELKGWGRVYWHTQASNATARRLYDRFRPADAVVRYTFTVFDN